MKVIGYICGKFPLIFWLIVYNSYIYQPLCIMYPISDINNLAFELCWDYVSS